MEFEETNDAVGNNFFCDHQFTSVFLLWFCFILLHFPVGGFHEFGADSKAFNLRFLRFEPKILTTGGFKVKKNSQIGVPVQTKPDSKNVN